MLNAIGQILGSGAVEKGIGLLDSLHTSDVEETKAKSDAQVRFIEAMAPHNVTMRLLALLFCGAFILSFLLCFVAVGIAWAQGDLARHLEGGSLELPLLIAITELLGAFKIQYAVGIILSFFFGGEAFGRYQDKKKEREVSRERERKKPRDDSAQQDRPPGR